MKTVKEGGLCLEAKDELHGQDWNYNKGGYFFHSYNIHPYYEGNYIENFHVEGFKRL